jgi:hypothetical protein
MSASRTDRGVEALSATEAGKRLRDRLHRGGFRGSEVYTAGTWVAAVEQEANAAGQEYARAMVEAAYAAEREAVARTNAALVERVEGLRKAAHIGIEALFGECRHDPALGTATDCDVLASAILTAAEPAPGPYVTAEGMALLRKANSVAEMDDIARRHQATGTWRDVAAVYRTMLQWAKPGAGPIASEDLDTIERLHLAAEPAGEQGTAEPARLYEDTPESEAAWRKYAADRPRRTGPRRGGFMPEGTERTPGEPAL